MGPTKDSNILIVGAGCFGISTAYHLLKRGYQNIVVIDRADELPAPDAASTDLNKIVRSAYSDEYYTHLAREAITAWKDREEWGDAYHESGVLVIGGLENTYSQAAYKNDLKAGAFLETVSGPSELSSKILPDIPLGSVFLADGPSGYFNKEGGWAYATGGVARAIELVRNLGGSILPGKSVKALIKDGNGRTKGVKCSNGEEISADVVVLATGSWTASTFPQLNLDELCIATGQTIATIRLTEEEQKRYSVCPVILDYGPSGFYTFPPTPDGLIKVARHTGGHRNPQPVITPDSENTEHPSRTISTPRTVLSHGHEGLLVPKEALTYLRDCLREVYPELAGKPFETTRLCWYTDSPDTDWIIDVHPDDPSLVLATAGSGHGYKFLPVIGRLISDRIEGVMPSELVKKFALSRAFGNSPASGGERDRLVPDADKRAGVQILKIDELVGPDGA